MVTATDSGNTDGYTYQEQCCKGDIFLSIGTFINHQHKAGLKYTRGNADLMVDNINDSYDYSSDRWALFAEMNQVFKLDLYPLNSPNIYTIVGGELGFSNIKFDGGTGYENIEGTVFDVALKLGVGYILNDNYQAESYLQFRVPTDNLEYDSYWGDYMKTQTSISLGFQLSFNGS
ncbi:hypothetical protein C9I98_08900 [Photobacterium sanctipauli]|uniref:Uncharacterized protein n=4 Tax=Photobacterium sanctipauli TaxID=1342794 RepID=A0A2T3NV65_9GAMM|nr:hypothetical protein C9I98_08900 [Photobacterium sanctipauli]